MVEVLEDESASGGLATDAELLRSIGLVNGNSGGGGVVDVLWSGLKTVGDRVVSKLLRPHTFT